MNNQIKNRKKLLFRYIALILVLSLAIVLVTDIVGFSASTPGGAYQSLPGIENIKVNTTEEDPFNILEIVPQAGSGTIGYYIPDYEPIFEGYADDLKTIEGEGGRRTYFNTKIDTLFDLGFISDTDDTLLTEIEYDEFIDVPWATKPSDFASYEEIDLLSVTGNTAQSRFETETYTGKFVAVSTGSNTGYFEKVNVYTIAPAGTTPTHGLESAEFVDMAGETEGTQAQYDFYYGVNFVDLDTLEEDAKYSALPVQDDDPATSDSEDQTLSDYLRNLDAADRVNTTPPDDAAGVPDPTKYFPETYLYTNVNGVYEFLGKTTDLTLVLDTFIDNFYVATVTGEPSNEYTDATPYAATNNVMSEDAADKKFVLSEKYELTDVGYGDYTFDPDYTGSDAETYEHSYNSIFIRTPYINNNWFNEYVFNSFADVSVPPVTVNSVTANLVSEEDVKEADLIVLSVGMNLTASDDDDKYENLADLYTDSNDITEAVKNQIVSQVDANSGMTPIIIDSRLEADDDDTTVLGALVDTYNGDDDDADGFVKDNVYVFAIDDDLFASSAADDDDEYHLSTLNFTTQFDASLYTNDDTPYNQIFAEIKNENFLRETLGGALLPEDVNIATAIRYIINFSDQRIITAKTAINVLEIQPIVPLDNSQDKEEADLTPEFVSTNYLNGAITPENINIDTMAVTEFIGKIDDITEKYDMVYIGASNNGFNLGLDGRPDYNDNDMDGMYYTNIGDITNYSSSNGGLLESEYKDTPSNQKMYDGSTQEVFTVNSGITTRYSGFDLTPSKSQEIIDFANSGFPIITSDKLIDLATPPTPAEDVEIELSTYNLVDKLVITVENPTERSIKPHTIAYQWYKDGNPIIGENSSSYTALEDGKYYCAITIIDSTATAPDTTENSPIITVEKQDNVLLSDVSTSGTLPITLIRTDGRYDSGLYYPLTNQITTGPHTLTPILNFSTDGLSTPTYSYYGDNYEYVNGTTAEGLTNTNIDPVTGALTAAAFNNSPSGMTTQVEINGYDFFSLRNGKGSTGFVRATNALLYENTDDFVDFTELNAVKRLGSSATSGHTSVYKLNHNASYNTSPTGITLSVAPTVPDFPEELTPIYTFEWYDEDKNLIQTEAGVERSELLENNGAKIIEGEKYSCVISDGVDAVFEVVYFTVKTGTTITSTTSANTSITIPERPSLGDVVNEGVVDNSSIMYETLEAVISKPNFMTSEEAKADPATVISYLNLSKPEIVFSTDEDSKPTEYTGVDKITGSLVKDNTVVYKFTIENATDPTPAQTTYKVELFVDTNADGLHNEKTELVPNLIIKDGEQIVNNGELKSGIEYTVSRQLPSNYEGSIPWKLQITQIDKEYAHNSATGITFIKPAEAIEIKVLQLVGQYGNAGGGDDSSYLFNAAPNKQEPLSSSTHFSTLFNDLKEKGIYDITTVAYSITELNRIYSGEDLSGNPYSLDVNTLEVIPRAGGLTGEDAINALFDEYDMLMFGFQESYGKLDESNGFIKEVAIMISDEIESGKPALFSHDNFSTEYAPYVDTGGSQSSRTMSSYYVNVLLRDASNQDRYGVVTNEYGFSEKNHLADQNPTGNYIVANAYKTPYDDTDGDATVPSTILDEISDAGYSIAYKPGSNKEELVQETQGFSTMFITWLGGLNNGNLAPTDAGYRAIQNNTNKVSQINKGQITSYPYNVNTDAFTDISPVGETLSIATTHQQWNQLNMNAEDVVVWYALTDNGSSTADAYSNHYNDATNTYYIYTVGNVTFTGAGHGIAGNITQFVAEEAELFVNTMIAAYRTASTDPEIEFEDEKGNILTSYYFPGIYSEDNLNANLLIEESFRLPFRVNDDNLTLRTLDIDAFYLEDEDGDYYLTVSGEMKESTFIDSADYDKDTDAPDSAARYTKVVNLKILDAEGNTANTVFSRTQYYLDLYNSKLPDGTSIVEFLAENDKNSLEAYIEVSTRDGEFQGLSDSVSLVKLGMLEIN